MAAAEAAALEQARLAAEEARLRNLAAQQALEAESSPTAPVEPSSAAVRRSVSLSTAKGRASSRGGGGGGLFNGNSPPPVLSRGGASIMELVEDASVAKCFLTFTSADTGMFKLHWSMERVEGALAVFVPKKPPPAFKLRTHGGVSELTRDCGGPNPKRFYQGWTSYVKAARSFDAQMAQLANVPLLPVTVYLNDARFNVIKLGMGETTEFDGIKAAAVVGLLRTDLHVGKMQTQLFQQTGERVGAAVLF